MHTNNLQANSSTTTTPLLQFLAGGVFWTDNNGDVYVCSNGWWTPITDVDLLYDLAESGVAYDDRSFSCAWKGQPMIDLSAAFVCIILVAAAIMGWILVQAHCKKKQVGAQPLLERTIEDSQSTTSSRLLPPQMVKSTLVIALAALLLSCIAMAYVGYLLAIGGLTDAVVVAGDDDDTMPASSPSPSTTSLVDNFIGLYKAFIADQAIGTWFTGFVLCAGRVSVPATSTHPVGKRQSCHQCAHW